MHKKHILFALIFSLLLSSMVFAEQTGTPKTPMVSFGNVRISAPATINLRPGETQHISVKLEKIPPAGTNDLSNLKIIGLTAITDKPEAVFILDSTFQRAVGSDVYYEVTVQASDLAQNSVGNITYTAEYYDSNTTLSETKATTNVRVLEAAPTITVSRTDIIPSNQIKPGDSFSVGFEFTNTGNAPLKNIVVSLEGLAEAKVGMTRGISSQTILNLPAGGREYIAFDLTAARDIEPGSHQVNMTWGQGAGENATGGKGSFSFFVSRGANQDSTVLIKNLVVPTGTLSRNQNFTVSFDLVNEGTKDARNIIVKAIPAEGSSVASKSVSQTVVPVLKPKESKPFSFDFIVSGVAETSNYPIHITAEYEDDSTTAEKKKMTEQFVGAFVQAPKDADDKDAPKSAPKLIIDKYTFDPQLVPAGSTFDMTLSFFNTNSEKTVKNIKIFLTSKENTDSKSATAGSSVFTPVDSSNTFYIDAIPPKGHVEKTIKMFTIPDAVAKTYEITANFEYEDSANNPFTATELIGIPVIQESKLEISEIIVPPEAFAGEPIDLSVDFYNTGKVTLFNTMVKATGDFSGDNLTYYVGNFESGSSESFNVTIFPNSEGELKGSILFTYEDSSGQEQKEEKEFTINVNEAMPMSEEDMEGMYEEPGKNPLKSPLLWIVLAAIIAIIVVVVKKIKKKRANKGLDLDE